jgi:quercetin dioxygenase-like cupin family protein
MKTLAAAIILLAFALPVALAQTQAVPVDKEPDHHLVLENEFTKVYFVEVPVGKQTLSHGHINDYVFVTTGDSDVENRPEGKEPTRLQLKDGETRFVKAPLVHVAKDLANTPFRNVTILILKPGDAGENSASNQVIVADGFTRKPIIDNNKVRVTECTFEAGASVPTHTHKLPHLVVAVSETHIRSDSGAQIDLEPGKTKWVPAGTTHSIKNTGSQAAHFVILEFK